MLSGVRMQVADNATLRIASRHESPSFCTGACRQSGSVAVQCILNPLDCATGSKYSKMHAWAKPQVLGMQRGIHPIVQPTLKGAGPARCCPWGRPHALP